MKEANPGKMEQAFISLDYISSKYYFLSLPIPVQKTV